MPCIALVAGACTDNVTCIFTTGCRGGGPISENEAFLPVDGEWILDSDPDVVETFPDSLQVRPSSPMVVVFTETIQEESLRGAIEVVPVLGGVPGPTPVTGVNQALVSEGRVLVLLPSADLVEGDYILRLSEQAMVLDLTGQALDVEPLEQLGDFTVTAAAPLVPQLVTTFPRDGATNQGETTEIVAVFDRPLLASSVTGDSFDVRVNGVDPADDPLAVPIQQGETRAFVYRSTDGNGRPVPLGTDVEVELRLSPTGDKILDEDDEELAATTISFETLAFEAPLTAALLSDPHDAIGLANLTDQDPQELMVEVSLDGGQPNDTIDLFLFGKDKSEETDPPLIALSRQKRLTGTAPITSVTFTREDVALQFSNDPLDVRFNDGSLTFAFRTQRGSVETPLRVLDLDPDPDTIRDPVLDTQVPEVASLVGSTDTSAFRSDLRGLSLAGIVVGDEQLRSVEVTTPLDDNGSLPPVIGAGDGAGRAFLAAPVPIDVVAGGGTDYSFTARDAALNAAPAESGAFTQVGVVGPAPFVLGSPIEVEVFDSRTLAPLENARVIVHSDRGDGANFPFIALGQTLPDGTIDVNTEGAPSVAAIVTVAKPGYDLFTLHGAPSAHLSVPLRATDVLSARATGGVRTFDAAASAFLQNLDLRFDDSRRSVLQPRGFAGAACGGQNPLVCPHPQQFILDEELGARSFFAGEFLQDTAFTPVQLLQAFALSVPLAPARTNAQQDAFLEVVFLLNAPDTPPEEKIQVLPEFRFQVDAVSGVDGPLDNDPETTGTPFVTVDALVPGLTGSIAVAQGLAYENSRVANEWFIRSVQPGAITAAGSLGSDGIVEPDPFVRVELADDNGNAAGVRPRLSTIVAAGVNPAFRALSTPTQLVPASGASSGGEAFTIELSHVIGDERSLNQKGLYRVELVDSQQRSWILWRIDPAGPANVPVPIRVVDVADGGAAGLADGDLQSQVTAWAWSSFSPTEFLWSDVEREFELFARAEPLTFVKPP